MTPDRIIVLLRSRGGVVRTRSLLRAGASAYELSSLAASGRISRPARGWISLPDADPELVAAARVGVVLTCVTQARRLGLWVLDDDGVHVAAEPHAKIRPTTAHVHWSKALVPRHPDALVDPIENVLTVVAGCQPREAAHAVWESAFNRGLVDRDVVGRFALPPSARELLAVVTPWSDSGLETFVCTRLAWLRLPVTPQVWIADHRVDFLIGDRLVLQVDGGHHVGRQREEDIAHDAALMLLGYHVIRVGYGQVIDRWHTVQDLILRAIAQGLHHAA